MKKILASILTIAMLISTMSACVIPASAEDAVATTASVETIYDADFDSYAVDGVNWLTYAPVATNYSYKPDPNDDLEFKIRWHGTTDTNKHTITVEYDPTVAVADRDENTNKVLKLAANGSAKNILSRFYPNGNRSRASMEGKKLVYSAKMFIPVAPTMDESTIMGQLLYNAMGSAAETGSFGGTISGALYPLTTGTYSSGIGRKWIALGTDNAYTNEWIEIKYVVDLSAPLSETHADTARYYINDNIQTVTLTKEGGYTHKSTDYYNVDQGTVLIDCFPSKPLFSDGKIPTMSHFYGATFMIAGKGSTTGTDYYYLDDLKAYLIDPLTYTLSNNFENYTGGKITLDFNQKIRETSNGLALNKLITLKDSNGATVSNGLADIQLLNDGKTISILPDQSLATGDYKLVLSPYFIDEYGQGLKNNSTATEIDLTVGEIVAFKATVAQPTITGYLEGNEATSVVTFSKAIAESSLANAITVKNTDTNAVVTEGFTYSLAADKKTLTFDFSGLPTASYTVTGSTAILSEELGENLAQEFVITIKDAIFYGTNFEDFIMNNADWTEANDKDYGYVSVPTENGNVRFYVRDGGTATTNAFVGLVDDPTGAANKVVKIDAGSATETIWFKPSHDGSGHDTSPIEVRANMEGKKLVYSAKVYLPNDASTGDSKLFASQPHGNTDAFNSMSLNGGAFWPINMSSGGYYSGTARTNVTAAAIKGRWAELKYVVDYSQPLSATHSDTIRVYVDGKISEANKEIAFPNTDPSGIYDLTRASYIDHLPSQGGTAGAFYASGAAGYSAGDFYGVMFKIVGNGSGKSVVYVDDIKAYLINPLSYELSDNFANYTGGKISLTFNQKIAETVTRLRASGSTIEMALSSLFTLKTAEGVAVPDGIAGFELSSDKKTITITPSANLIAGDYKLVISPYFVDIHGQGLNNNSTEREIDLKVGEIVAFKATVAQPTITGYIEGATATSTVTFAKPINESSLANAITVKNTDTGAIVTEGFTYSLAADKKTLTFDFSNLPTASYTVTGSTDILSEENENLVQEFKITIKSGMIYNIHFNDLVKNDVDLTDKNAYTNSLKPEGKTDGYFYLRDGDGDATLTVEYDPTVASPTADTNKVLKFNAGTAAETLYFRAYHDGAQPGRIPILTRDQMEGKKLVYTAKIFFPTDFSSAQGGEVLGTFNHNSSGKQYMALDSRLYPAQAGSYSNGFARADILDWSGATLGSKYGGRWINIKYVVDYSAPLSATHSDTTRAYFDDKIVVGVQGETEWTSTDPNGIYDTSIKEWLDYLPAEKLFPSGTTYHSMGDFYGAGFKIKSNGSGKSIFYIDDLQAYLVNPLTYELSDNFANYTGGTISLAFNQKIAESVSALTNGGGSNTKALASLFTIKDSNGNTINGISDVKLSDDKKTVIITPAELSNGSTYTLVISPYFVDIHGQGLKNNSTATEITLTTAKSNSVYAEATATVTGATVTAEVTLTNPIAEAKTVWGGIAVFGAYNEMLGFTPITATEIGANGTKAETITVNATSSNITAVKLFVWDSYTNMVPYQKAETLFPLADAQ